MDQPRGTSAASNRCGWGDPQAPVYLASAWRGARSFSNFDSRAQTWDTKEKMEMVATGQSAMLDETMDETGELGTEQLETFL